MHDVYAHHEVADENRFSLDRLSDRIKLVVPRVHGGARSTWGRGLLRWE